MPLTILLTTLRIGALVGLLFFLLNLEKRSEQQITRNSRVAVLVDTSLSMGLRDTGDDAATSVSRIEEVSDFLAQTDFVSKFRDRHDVVAYEFSEDAKAKEIAAFNKTVLSKQTVSQRESALLDSQVAELAEAKKIFYVAIGVLALALVLAVIAIGMRFMANSPIVQSSVLAFSLLALIVGVGILAASDLRCIPADLMQTVGFREFKPILKQEIVEDSDSATEPEIDWQRDLVANGTLTRMGDALRYVINKEREGPIAGIVVVTDGRNNSGSDHLVSIATARDANIPIFTVGSGSDKAPKNARIVDIKVPQRVFPGDKFKLTGLVQSFGYATEELKVQLFSVDEKATEAERLDGESTVLVGIDGKPEPVTFELSNEAKETRIYRLKILTPSDDLDPSDNISTSRVEFVDRKVKVLLVAGGPTRDYRFLRNALHRNEEIVSDVYLQTAEPGADQESNDLLFDFPDTRAEWFNYDCIVGFDPDWRMLSAQQAKWLEDWVAQKAGGLIVIAGPVNTPEWTRRTRGDETIDVIRKLYPVSFYNQATSVMKLGRFGGTQPFPLAFSREGRASEFLWLGETGPESADIWDDSKGVFGYYAVNEPKPGAEIFARFSDKETAIDGELPIYMAGHFYGAGRVFFQASGEMWRLRPQDPEYFSRYYNKLIRWASQGRLSRDSTRGVLLVDKNKCWLGDQVTIQAILRDPQDKPLMAASVPAVVLQPGGKTQTIDLLQVKDGAQSGTFTGQLVANRDGKYRISLPIPQSEGSVLTANVRATIPDLEIEQPERNDTVLQQIADQTGGKYFKNIRDTLVSDSEQISLPALIEPQDQETVLPGTTDREFTRRLMIWLLSLIVLVFCVEWITRRLNKLA